MSAKRKRGVVVACLIVTFMLLGWQIFRLVASDLDGSAIAANKPSKRKKQVHYSTSMKIPEQEKWNPVTHATPEEKRYLHLASEIQEAKMHHQLLQQQVAIAEAEKKLALSHQQTVDLSPAGTEEIASWSKTSNTNYALHLVYLAKVANGRWEATLKKGSELLHVGRGTDLGNGRHVAAIIERGLWLQDAQGVRWLGFPGEPAPSGAAAASVRFVQHKQPKQHRKVVRNHVAKKRKKHVTKKPVKYVILSLPHWLRPQSLHVLQTHKIKKIAVKQKKRHLTSDEMLFLEQPSEGVTLLAPLHNENPSWLKLLGNDRQMESTFKINIEGKEHLAVGLFKTASTARIKALAYRGQIPTLRIAPVSIELLQQSLLHTCFSKV